MIGAELQASVSAGSIMAQQNVHHSKKLFNALVLAEVLTTLHQERVITLIIPADDQIFGTTNGGHYLYLQSNDSHVFVNVDEKLLSFKVNSIKAYPFVEASYLCVILW